MLCVVSLIAFNIKQSYLLKKNQVNIRSLVSHDQTRSLPIFQRRNIFSLCWNNSSNFKKNVRVHKNVPLKNIQINSNGILFWKFRHKILILLGSKSNCTANCISKWDLVFIGSRVQFIITYMTPWFLVTYATPSSLRLTSRTLSTSIPRTLGPCKK